MKKAARAKRKAKAVGSKRAKPRPAEKVTPSYLKQGASLRMGLHDVIKVVQMIEKRGHLGTFTSRLRRRGAEVTLPAETVNLVKDFVAEKGMHTTAMGKHIVFGRGAAAKAAALPQVAGTIEVASDAPGDDPNECHFGKVEQG